MENFYLSDCFNFENSSFKLSLLSKDYIQKISGVFVISNRNLLFLSKKWINDVRYGGHLFV